MPTVLRTLRLLTGRNLIQQGRAAHVHPTTLCRFENLVYTAADRPKTLAKLAKYHRLPVALLLSPATPENLAKATRRKAA